MQLLQTNSGFYGTELHPTSPSDRAVVDPMSCRFWVRNSGAARCYALRPSFSGSCPRPCGSERASEIIVDKPGQEPTIVGRPAHDHWTISPSSGQHTSHYLPVMIVLFPINRSRGVQKKFIRSRAAALQEARHKFQTKRPLLGAISRSPHRRGQAVSLGP